MIEDQILDVEGRVIFSGTEENAVDWLSKRSPQDVPAVYARVGVSGRVIPVSDYIKYAAFRGHKIPVDSNAAKNEICSILTAFADVSATGVLDEEELSRLRSTAAEQIIALFKGE